MQRSKQFAHSNASTLIGQRSYWRSEHQNPVCVQRAGRHASQRSDAPQGELLVKNFCHNELNGTGAFAREAMILAQPEGESFLLTSQRAIQWSALNALGAPCVRRRTLMPRKTDTR
jgi:hypothetical protein